MKFNSSKSITLNQLEPPASKERQLNGIKCIERDEQEQQQLKQHLSVYLDSSFELSRQKVPTNDACVDGIAGYFSTINNDFTPQYVLAEHRHFKDKPQWSHERRERVKKVRFLICALGLLGLALSQMSRTILNVAIVEMVKKVPTIKSSDEISESLIKAQTIRAEDQLNLSSSSSSSSSSSPHSFDHYPSENQDANESLPVTYSASTATTTTETIMTTLMTSTMEFETMSEPVELQQQIEKREKSNSDSADTGADFDSNADADADRGGAIKFDWSPPEQNFLLSSFYIGYFPFMLISGGFVDKYGSKYPMFICVLGSTLINLLTPTIARYNFTLLIGSRILLGILQGGLVPSAYDLLNKWLTLNETSLFAPLIKVSFALGAFLGSMFPGLTTYFGLPWTVLFYLSGSLCGIWTLLWFPLATSTPHTNPFVKPNELDKIIRKKELIKLSKEQQQQQNEDAQICGSEENLSISVISRKTDSNSQDNLINHSNFEMELKDLRIAQKLRDLEETTSTTEPQNDTQSTTEPSISFSTLMLIVCNPSVLALTLVKFTYNVGQDFFVLELSIYMKQIHHASTETISAILSGGTFMQMILITFIGWGAKSLVQNRTFGLSRTKWRKLFQGSSNFIMAAMYFLTPLTGSNVPLLATIVIIVFFAWMLGAGGELMVPYDLSSKYPATIVGLAHSVSILSGLVVPSACSIVLGKNNTDPERWNLLFLMVGGTLTFGGLVFILVLKAKPFLPEEKQQQQQQQVNQETNSS